MNREDIRMEVAPSMGNFEEGIKAFQGLEPPYGRGGGTPATKYLQQQVLKYLAISTVTEEALAPSVTITPNGQAANNLLLRALYGGGIVASSHLFGTTKQALTHTFQRIGRNKLSWVNPYDTQAFIDNTTRGTTAWFLEAVSNPRGLIGDLAELKAEANKRGVLLILDMTLAAGMPEFKGLEYADVLTASMTKQAGGGENRNMGGAIIIRHEYILDRHVRRLRELKHYFKDAAGTSFVPKNPLGALVTKIGLPEGSNCIAPEMAISIGDCLPHVGRTVEKMSQNALILARFLEQHPKIAKVELAGYNTGRDNDERMQRYCGTNHFVVLADIHGGIEGAKRFINAEEIFHAVALGQMNTAISNPATSTHRSYPKPDLAKMGFGEGTIRISVGCEDAEELIGMFSRSLELC
jgi:O-acetylhomoserine (thiol)-lyase